MDPWAGANQGLSSYNNSMMTLAQLKRQDAEDAQRSKLVDLQTQAAQQSVDQNKITLADLGAKQGALIDQYGTAGHADPLTSAYSFQQQEGQDAAVQEAKQKGFQIYLNTLKSLDGVNLDPETKTKIGKHFLAQNPEYAPFAENLKYVDSKGVKAARMFQDGELKDPVTKQPLPAGYYETEGRWTGDAANPVELLSYKQAEPPKNDKETWGKPYIGQVGGKSVMLQDSSTGQVKAVVQDASTTVKLNTGGSGGGKSSGHGGGGMGITMNGLNQSQRDALTAAIGEGRLDPYKINSKNQQILADAAVANPGINLNDMAANLGLARNKDVQMKGAIAETVPPLLKSIVENGKKLDYSDNQFIGMAQQWIDKKTNNPQFVKYMSLRNDQLLTLGGIMRSNGMTDMAQRLEEEAAHPTMSPRALEGWLEGQMESVNPRLKMYRSIREGKGAPREESGGTKLSAGASFIKDQFTAYGKAGLTEEARQQRILQKMKQRGWTKEQIGAAWLEYKGQ